MANGAFVRASAYQRLLGSLIGACQRSDGVIVQQSQKVGLIHGIEEVGLILLLVGVGYLIVVDHEVHGVSVSGLHCDELFVGMLVVQQIAGNCIAGLGKTITGFDGDLFRLDRFHRLIFRSFRLLRCLSFRFRFFSFLRRLSFRFNFFSFPSSFSFFLSFGFFLCSGHHLYVFQIQVCGDAGIITASLTDEFSEVKLLLFPAAQYLSCFMENTVNLPA